MGNRTHNTEFSHNHTMATHEADVMKSPTTRRESAVLFCFQSAMVYMVRFLFFRGTDLLPFPATTHWSKRQQAIPAIGEKAREGEHSMLSSSENVLLHTMFGGCHSRRLEDEKVVCLW